MSTDNSKVEIIPAIKSAFSLYKKHFVKLFLCTASLSVVFLYFYSLFPSDKSWQYFILSFIVSFLESTITFFVIWIILGLRAHGKSYPVILTKIFVTGLIGFLFVLMGLIFLVIPGLILLTYWSLSDMVVLDTGIYGKKALDASKKMVKGNWWKMFTLVTIFIILFAVISWVSSLLPSFPFKEYLVAVVASPVYTILTLANIVIYQKLKSTIAS